MLKRRSTTDGAILDGEIPSEDELLAQDMAFHLGSRDDYDPQSIERVTIECPVPDNNFIAFQIGKTQILSGKEYQEFCEIGGSQFKVRSPKKMKRKQLRTIKTLNKYLPFLDPNVPYAFDLADARRHRYDAIFRTEKPIPVFQYHRHRSCVAPIHPLVKLHDFELLRLQPHDLRAFSEKVPRIFWRGSLTGRIETPEGDKMASKVADDPVILDMQKVTLLSQSLRFTVCRQARENDAIDAGFAVSEGLTATTTGLPIIAELSRPPATIQEHLEYKYLLALDGYDGPSSWFWMIRTNSLVLRQRSEWQLMGDNYFRPWIHYVPIAADGSDLMQKFDWCERHPAKCEKIVRNANRAASLFCSPEYQSKRIRLLHQTYRQWFS